MTFFWIVIKLLLLIVQFTFGQKVFDDPICTQRADQSLDIYGADSLLNSTLRLYTRHHNYDLILFVKLTDDRDLPTFFETFDGSPIYGFLKGPQRTYFNYGIIDSKSSGIRTIVTVNDGAKTELTTVFNSMRHAVGHFWTFNTHKGTLVSQGSLADIFITVENQSFEITTAFRAFIDDDQFLFLVVNNDKIIYSKLNTDNFDNNTASSVSFSEDAGRFFNGSLPSMITAAFVIQLSPHQNVLVLFRCNEFCVVHFIKNKWNFERCHKPTSWRDLWQFVRREVPIGDRYIPFSYTQHDSTSSGFLSFLSQFFETLALHFQSFKANIRRFIQRYPFIVVILVVLIGLQVLYWCIVWYTDKQGEYELRHDSESVVELHHEEDFVQNEENL